MTTLRGTLAHPTVQRITAASGLSNLGTGIFVAVLPLTVATYGGGPLLIGVVSASLFGWWLVSIPLSLLVDRLGAGPVLRLVAPLRVGSVLVLATHVLFDGSWRFVPIIAGALLVGLSDVLVDTATATLPGLLLDESQYDDAYSVLSGVGRITNLVIGPVLGAGLLWLGTAVPFVVAAACLAAAFACYARFFADPKTGPQPSPSPSSGGWREVFAGVRHVVTDRFLTAVAVTLVGVALAAEVAAVVVAPYLRDGLGSPAWPQILGALHGAAGVGAIIAAFTAGILARRFGRLRVLRVVACGGALSPALLATSPQVASVLAALVVAAVAEAIWVPLVQAEVMRRTPTHLLARTRAAIMFMTWGALPVTGLLGGAVAQLVGVRITLLIAAAIALASCGLGIWRRQP